MACGREKRKRGRAERKLLPRPSFVSSSSFRSVVASSPLPRARVVRLGSRDLEGKGTRSNQEGPFSRFTFSARPTPGSAMGGGVSSPSSALSNGGSQISAASLLGRAFASIAFPGHYRLQDFHSPSARKLDTHRAPPLFPALSGGGVMGDM